MNDRQLRFIVNGLNGKSNGVPRGSYDITVASEIMAASAYNGSEDLDKLGRIVIGYSYGLIL